MNFYLRAMTPKEFCSAVGFLISTKTARAWCRCGKLDTVHGRNKRPYLIKPEVLTKYRADVSHLIVRDETNPRQ